MSGPPSTQPAEPKESLYAMSTLTTRTIVPTGTWVVDQAHSKAGFAVNHTGIATVRGEFTEFQGTLQIAGELSSAKAYGTVKAASVDTNEPQRDAHPALARLLRRRDLPRAGIRVHGARDHRRRDVANQRQRHPPRRDERDRPHRRGQPHRHRPVRQREGRQRWQMGRRGLTDGDLAQIELEMETNI